MKNLGGLLMEYDLKDVKSVQKFLVQMKDVADNINAELGEDAKVKFDYEDFTEQFYKANEGILKNRDTIKQEKLKVAEDFNAYKTEVETQWGNVDTNIVAKYDAAVSELASLKESIKDSDGGFDIDKLKAQAELEKAELEKSYNEKLLEETKPLTEQLEKLSSDVGRYKGKYFSKLKKEAVENELDRIKVNPEDKALILEANLGRAEIAETEDDNISVVFKDNDGHSVALSKYWDMWASNDKHQKYILSEDNSGGGSQGGTHQGVTAKDKLLQKLTEAKTLKERMMIKEQISRIENEK